MVYSPSQSPSACSSTHRAQPSPLFQLFGHAQTPCPTYASSCEHPLACTRAQPKAVQFEPPDCGWPSRCTEEPWQEGQQCQKYDQRQANEDKHDFRGERRLLRFELLGELYTQLPVHSNTFLMKLPRSAGISRSPLFCQLDTEHSPRHPISIDGIVRWRSCLTLSNQHFPSEGSSRSLAGKNRNDVRLFSLTYPVHQLREALCSYIHALQRQRKCRSGNRMFPSTVRLGMTVYALPLNKCPFVLHSPPSLS